MAQSSRPRPARRSGRPTTPLPYPECYQGPLPPTVSEVEEDEAGKMRTRPRERGMYAPMKECTCYVCRWLDDRERITYKPIVFASGEDENGEPIYEGRLRATTDANPEGWWPY